MDILLINPPWMTKDGNIWHGVKSTSPPLGLLYVAAYAEDRGRTVHVMDVNAERLHFEDIERLVADRQPPWVGMTAVTAQIINTHRIAGIIKRVSPASKVVVGGVHATAMPDEVLQDHCVDFVIRGEGEIPFFDLVDGRPLDSIGGLSYRAHNPLQPTQHNPLAEPIEDLDALPTPAYHLIRFELYKPAIGAYRRLPSINMTMTRGCPGKCTFCNSAETALRTQSAEHVVDEIQRLQARYGVREVSFYDDTLTIFKPQVARMCELILERGIDLTWSCFARTDCVSPPLLKRMRAAGCHQILFGIESADPDILRNIRKPIDIEQTRKAVRMVQEAGIAVRAAFMFGNPGETVETMRRTIDFAKRLDPDIALFNITTPYPGTQMFEWARRNGYLRTLDWNDYDLANSVIELPTVSSEEINRMYKVAYREFYFRPWYLVRRLTKMRNWDDIRCNLQALRSVMFTKTTRPPSTDARPASNRWALRPLVEPSAPAAACI
ncbi:MAG: cobalamin-dependent protein [Planctomycetota bacterium]